MAYITSKKPEMWQCQKKWLIIVRYRKEFQHHINRHEPLKLAWIKRFEVYWAQDLLLYSIITTTICGLHHSANWEQNQDCAIINLISISVFLIPFEGYNRNLYLNSDSIFTMSLAHIWVYQYL